MTEVKVFKKGAHIMKVVCDGHTGYGAQGEDIVCAALSSVVQTAVLGLVQVAGINLSFKRDDEMGFIEFTLPAVITETERKAADIILDTMLCGVADLHEGYSDFIELEVKQNVY